MDSLNEGAIDNALIASNDDNMVLSNDDRVDQYFKDIVASSDDAIISKNLQGIVTSWNVGAHLLFGYSAQEMVGHSLMRLFPPDKTDEEKFILEKIIAGEKVHHFETVRIHKDGSALNISVTISPIYDQQGTIIGASKVARDISERMRLDSEAQKYQAIVQSSDDAIISKSLNGIVTSWNRGAQAMFGYSAEEMIGQSMLALLPADRQSEEAAILNRLRKGQKVDHFETLRLCKDGRLIEVSVTISPIFDQCGTVIGASKIARDITDKKKAEARLELTSRVFTNTNEAIVITDAYGIIIEVNEAFSSISGYARDDVIGHPPTMFSSSRQGPEIMAIMLDSLDRHGRYQGELWSRRKNGESYAGYVKVSIVRDAANNVQNYVALFADITSLRIKQEELEHLAHFDALTDLPNRILLSDRLHQAMALSQRTKKSLAVLYLDLDGFKDINDEYGHNVGDEMLVAVSHNMKAVLRNVDTLARIGGDEYAVVLADVQGPHQCGAMVERILHACAKPVVLQGNLLRISASIGVTIYPQDDVDADQLLRHADRAMYEAKQAGKNRYHIFDSVLDAEVKTLGLQHERIRHALAANEFFLRYQPKVNMRTGIVVGVEALIRWNHPELGVLSPAEFLPSIEFHPLSEQVDEWVLNAALWQMDAWRNAGLTISVSVNIGARQLQKKDFAQRLATVLANYPDVDPHMLDIEILETSALQDIHAVADVIRECQQTGVCFSVDDFGTGYSSLTYLRHFPAETLKIDRSFVGNMLEDCENRAIVEAIVGLATVFRRDVLAEGVETVEIAEKLLELGCELGQGYGISKPLLAAEVPAWVANWQSLPS